MPVSEFSHKDRTRAEFAKWVLVLSIVGYPLIAPLALLLNIDSRLVSIPFRGLLLLMAAVPVALQVLEARNLRLSLFWTAFFAFWALYLGRIGLDSLFNPAALRLTTAEYVSFAIGTVLLPAMAVASSLDSRAVREGLMLTACLGAAGIAANIGLILGSGGGASAIVELYGSRQGTETLNPITLGHIGVTVVITACLKLLLAPRMSVWLTAALFAILATGLIAIVLGASRGPMLALIITAPMLAYVAIRSAEERNRGRILLLTIGALAALCILMLAIREIALWVRFQSLLSGGDASLGARIDLLAGAIDRIMASPILGGGIEPLGIYPHNLIVESFLVFGVLSGILFLILIVSSTINSLQLVRLRPDQAWIAILFIQYAVAGMVSGALYASAPFWVLLAATAVCRERLFRPGLRWCVALPRVQAG